MAILTNETPEETYSNSQIIGFVIFLLVNSPHGIIKLFPKCNWNKQIRRSYFSEDAITRTPFFFHFCFTLKLSIAKKVTHTSLFKLLIWLSPSILIIHLQYQHNWSLGQLLLFVVAVSQLLIVVEVWLFIWDQNLELNKSC